MNDPALIPAMLLLVLVGEGVLWFHRKDEKVSRWKFRAMLYGVALVIFAGINFQPAIGIRFDLVLGVLYLVLLACLGAVIFYIRRKLQGFNRVLLHAQSLHNLGKTAEAIDVLQAHRQQAARFDKNTESILLTEMARMSADINDLAAAERFLSEAEASSELNQGVYVMRSELAAKAGEHDAACEVLRRGLEKLPTSAWLNTALAERLADAGRTDDAREALARTIELLDHEKQLDVADPEEWRELRIAPLVQRLQLSPGPDPALADQPAPFHSSPTIAER